MQEGFLPVPIASVPPESLCGLEIFIYTAPTYNLYKSSGLEFGIKDYQRLLNAGTQYVYIEIKNHQRYYDAIESSLADIIKDKSIAIEKKCEILYATTLALSHELTSSAPETDTITKAHKHTRNTIDLILANPHSFGHLFNISNHDFYTATHSSNVSIMLVSFAHKIGIKDPELLNQIGTGGLLHDVGKIFVPKELLNNSEKLTNEEFELIKGHVQKGVEHLIAKADLSDIVIKIVAEHHERVNGSGYPEHLTGDDISIYGKMIAIIDMFEAMTSVRPYREIAIPTAQAMNFISEMAPEQLDLRIVNSFDNFMKSEVMGIDIEDNGDNLAIMEALCLSDSKTVNISGRRHKRFYFRARSSVQSVMKINNTLSFGEEHSIIAHNISQSGIGILSSHKYSVGQYICITIQLPNKKKEIKYFAAIRRVVDHADGWFTVGAEFLKEQSTEQVMKVIENLK